MRKIAIFASGSGSNFQAIADAIQEGQLEAKIELVLTDKPGAYVVTRAEKAGIKTVALMPKTFASKQAYEEEIVRILHEKNVEWIVLAGYMRLVGETLLTAFPNRIINIHPSLLPSFPGKDAIGQAVAHGVKVTGVTVHYVDAGMDTGPIIAQVPVEVGATLEETAERIHAAEHKLYPATLQRIFE